MVYPKSIIPRCIVCKKKMSAKLIRKLLLQCVENTPIFDCETSRAIENAEVVI